MLICKEVLFCIFLLESGIDRLENRFNSSFYAVSIREIPNFKLLSNLSTWNFKRFEKYWNFFRCFEFLTN